MIKRNGPNERVKRHYLHILRKRKAATKPPWTPWPKRSIASKSTPAPRLQEVSCRTGAGVQGAPDGDAQRANRRTVVGFDDLFDACGPEGLFRVARPTAGLPRAAENRRRRVFQFAGQFVSRRHCAAIQGLPDAQANSRDAGPRGRRLRHPVRRARPGDCVLQAETYRHRKRIDRTRRARGPDEAGEDLYDLVLRSAKTFARFSSIGSPSCASKKASGRKTLSSRNRRSRPATISNFGRSASTRRIGRTPIRFVQSFAKPAPAPAYPISIRIRCETRLSNWPMS